MCDSPTFRKEWHVNIQESCNMTPELTKDRELSMPSLPPKS